MLILALDTSADETSGAITSGRRVLSYVNYTQILIHREWGGIVPSIAKRAHEERIDFVVEETCRKAKTQLKDIDYIAVTYGPGLAIALEVGIKKAKELAIKYNKKLIAVNHMEGHIYSSFVQNQNGNPNFPFKFPYLALLISGGHSEIVLFKDHLKYEIIGQTRDDAAGEALDKAARMLGLGYPGGEVLEKLALKVGNIDSFNFPRPMIKTKEVEFSFAGLKTALFYFLKDITEEEKNKNLCLIASSFQEAVLDSIVAKTKIAISQTGVNRLVVGGGVSANKRLRLLLGRLIKKSGGSVIFPPFPYLTGDNAAMIGVVAHFKAEKKLFVDDLNLLDRQPRLVLA